MVYKKPLVVFIFSFLPLFQSIAQDRAFYIAAQASMISERRTAMIYGSGLEEKISKTINAGIGLKTVYVRNRTKFGIGLVYVNRKYKMTRPFDHCLFAKSGEGCLKYLAHVDRYNHHTVEIPLSFDFRIYEKNKFHCFLGATYTNAFLLRSKYHTSVPDLGVKNVNGNFQSFSKSLYGQIGVTYRAKKRLLVNLQPFVRINCKQRNDRILFEQNQLWIETWWDSFGLVAELHYRLGIIDKEEIPKNN